MIDTASYIEKLNKLKDWIAVVIDCKTEEMELKHWVFKMYNTTGFLPSIRTINSGYPTFPDYLKIKFQGFYLNNSKKELILYRNSSY